MRKVWRIFLRRGIAEHVAGFLLILEPFETDNATVPNPVFHFTLVHLEYFFVMKPNGKQMPGPIARH